MKKGITRALSIALLGGAFAFWGCEKVAPTELSPVTERANHVLSSAKATETTSPAQAAWLRFVERVERGEIKDPVGQYVAKGTKAEVDAEGRRIARPKVDVLLRDAGKGYALRAGKKASSGVATRSIDEPCELQDYNPDAPCYNGPVGGGGGPGGPGGPGSSVSTIFVSSESSSTYTDPSNPNGYIYDLKIVKDGDNLEQPLPGYVKINVDLNRGAGGEYIYLAFTRRPSYVQLGDETGWGWPQNQVSGPVRQLQAFVEPTGISISWTWGHTPSQGFVPIWAPNPIPGSSWKHPDLNDGAGGAWIYGYQFKDPAFHASPIEVGVIASNTQYPVPPTDWHADYTQDLNKGAGGDYIYFCYKDK